MIALVSIFKAFFRACHIAKKAAKKHGCYAYVSLEDDEGCESEVAVEYDYSEKYDEL
jgi:hypothetical protein